MYPPKLHPGDTLRVLAPSRSFAIISEELRQVALQTLAELGLQITFSENIVESDGFKSSTITSRVEDLHKAFSDPQVQGILTGIGGYNSNQLLASLDYDLIQRHPKIFCGYSDITALENAIYAKTGLVTFSGPHFSTFGMRQGIAYTIEYFRKCLMQSDPFEILPSEAWSDDAWYRDQEERNFIPNPGYRLVQNKLQIEQVHGRILGGNLCTLNLLQGTPYMPDLQNSILLLEDDAESSPEVFDRDLQSLLHQPGFPGVRAMILGRFQNASNISAQILDQIIQTKAELENIPVIADANFGHCTPQFTFPVGGWGSMLIDEEQIHWRIETHLSDEDPKPA